MSPGTWKLRFVVAGALGFGGSTGLSVGALRCSMVQCRALPEPPLQSLLVRDATARLGLGYLGGFASVTRESLRFARIPEGLPKHVKQLSSTSTEKYAKQWGCKNPGPMTVPSVGLQRVSRVWGL